MPEPEIQLPEINNETTNESVEGAFRRIGMRLKVSRNPVVAQFLGISRASPRNRRGVQ